MIPILFFFLSLFFFAMALVAASDGSLGGTLIFFLMAMMFFFDLFKYTATPETGSKWEHKTTGDPFKDTNAFKVVVLAVKDNYIQYSNTVTTAISSERISDFIHSYNHLQTN